MPGPTFGFVKPLASSGSHCTKWADEQHRQAGFESRLLPDLPLPFIPTLIGLRAFDLVSSRVWWEAATNTMCYNQTGDISTLEGTPLKLVDKFTYLGSSVESTEKDIETRLTKAWTAINRLSIIWKSDLTDKMKRSFFQAAVTSILLYGCTTWTLTKRLEKKLDGNYTRMLRAILNKSWQQHPTRHQLYGHLPLSRKLFKLDEPDMQDTTGEADMNS